MLRADAPRWWAGGAATILLAAAFVLAPAPAAGQQDSAAADSAQSQQAAAADSVVQEGEIEYERETFVYPGRDRNPFEPVNAGVQEGPRFQNLVLAGIIYSPSVGSVAVLVDNSTGRRYRIREGERIGQATVLSIRRSDVLFSVTGPTQSRQETLQVEKETEEVQR